MSHIVDLQEVTIKFRDNYLLLAAEKGKPDETRCKALINKYQLLTSKYFNIIYSTLNISILSRISKIIKGKNFIPIVTYELTMEAHQDAFLNFYRNIEKFDPNRTMTTWLYRIADNEALKVLYRETIRKKETSFTSLYYSEENDEEYGTREIISNNENSEAHFSKIYENSVDEVIISGDELLDEKYQLALECIEELPSDRKTIIVDKYINNIKQVDLEKYYGLNLNTIKSRDRKAKRDLNYLYQKRVQKIYEENSY